MHLGGGVPGRPPQLPRYTLPKSRLTSGSSRHLAPEGSSPVWLTPCCLPSPISQPGGDFLPGTSYIPSRAAYSSCSWTSCRPQCPALWARSAHSWELASHGYSRFRGGPPGMLPVTCLPLPGLWSCGKSAASGTSLKCRKTGLLIACCFCGACLPLGSLFLCRSGRSEVTGKAAHWHTQILADLFTSRF